MKRKRRSKYQFGIRVAVWSVFLFLVFLSFGLELLFNR